MPLPREAIQKYVDGIKEDLSKKGFGEFQISPTTFVGRIVDGF